MLVGKKVQHDEADYDVYSKRRCFARCGIWRVDLEKTATVKHAANNYNLVDFEAWKRTDDAKMGLAFTTSQPTWRNKI
jgi:hypothetical protein